MHKANELLGKEVLDQDTGEKRATVEGLVFDDGLQDPGPGNHA